jgi:hypothetical protein
MSLVPAKTLATAAAALALALVTFSPAEAANGRKGAAAAGIVGGLALGAAIAAGAAGAAAAPAPVVVDDEPECRIVVRRVWVEGFGWRRQREEVCD